MSKVSKFTLLLGTTLFIILTLVTAAFQERVAAQPIPTTSATRTATVQKTSPVTPKLTATLTSAGTAGSTPNASISATPAGTPSVNASATPALSPNVTPTASVTPTLAPSSVTPVVTIGSKIPFADRFTFRKTDQVTYLKPGLIHLKRTDTGPININLLLFDLTAPEFKVKVAFRDDWLSGVARTSQLAKANDALAAVNGDLFSASGLPQGMAMTDGKLASSPKRRATFAYSRLSGPFIGFFTQDFTWPANVVVPSGEQHTLEILNNVCRPDWLCVYNDLYRQLTPSGNEPRVLLNPSNEVIGIYQGELVKIPEEHHVLWGRGQAGDWLLQHVKVGDRLELNFKTDPDYKQYQQVVSGGPIFLRNGAFIQDCLCFLEDCSESKQKEVVCEEFTTDWKSSHYYTIRMPRNAIGYNVDKSVLIVAVVDGYQPGFSIGMTQRELANLFLEFGAESAMELDGGGSATMFLDGKLASHPSDGGGSVERAVPNAVLFFWDEASSQPEPTTTPRSTITAGSSPTTTKNTASATTTAKATTTARPATPSGRATPTS